jgi:hypothetical protein
MHAAAGESHAVVERLLVDVQANSEGFMLRIRPA